MSSTPSSAKNATTTSQNQQQQQQQQSSSSPSSSNQQQQQQHYGTPAHQYETIESLRAQLALAQENYKRQIKNLRNDKENLQSEITAIRADCSLIATRLDDALVRARKAEQSEKAMKEQIEFIQQDSKEKMEALRERQCDAPAIDEAIFKNYKELRTLLFDRCGAEFMTVEEQWHFARSSPLAVLEMTREWFWKFTECFELVSQQVELQRGKWKEEKDELMNIIKYQHANGVSASGSHAQQITEHSSSSVVSSPSAAAKPITKQFGNVNNNKTSSSGKQSSSSNSNTKSNSNKNTGGDDEDTSENVDQLQQRIGVLRRECALSKSENLRAHKAVVTAEQKQRHLQQMLEKAHKQLQEAVEATSSSTARKQVEEVKKQMRIALNQKEDEISSLKMQFEKDVVALTKQIQGLSDQNSKADRLHAQLTIQRQENKDLRNQLARTDVKTLENYKKRADRELMELRSHTNNLESTVDTLKLRLAAAKQLAVDAKSKYSALFEAHLQEAKSRQADAARKKMKQIRRDVVGSDSALTKYHFEHKYQALSQELANTQQKLKRLLMIAHHDQVAHDAEIEQMQMHAVAYYEKQQKKEEDEFWASSPATTAMSGRGGRGGDQHYVHHHPSPGNPFGNSPVRRRSPDSAQQQQQTPGSNLRTQQNQQKQKHVTDRNLFHSDGALREQLQQNVIVGENKTVVEEIARVVGEGVVQDVRSWTPTQRNNERSDGTNPLTKMSLHDPRSSKRGNNNNLAASTSASLQHAGSMMDMTKSGTGVSFGQTSSRFEVSARTALAASSAKQKSDLTEYFDEREKQEAMRQQKKVQLSMMGHRTGAVGEFVSPGGGLRDQTDVSKQLQQGHSALRPPRGGGGLGGSSTPEVKPSQNSVQFFIEGSSTPMGVRERRVL